MNTFQLDPRLDNDCYTLGRFETSQLLLLNNACVPWFILVPETEQLEFFMLDQPFQLDLLQQINQLSVFIKQNFEVSKINTALIGNIVQQMHIHIIGRHESDPYWPGVVWGQKPGKPYLNEDALAISEKTQRALPTLTALSFKQK